MLIPRWLITVLLLVGSNTFMTWAWYGHLKRVGWTLPIAIGVSWLIALPEYLLQVPANRIGHVSHGGPFTAPELKIIQEAVTLIVFIVFSIMILHERPRSNDYAAFALIMAAVGVSMFGRVDRGNGGPEAAPSSQSVLAPSQATPERAHDESGESREAKGAESGVGGRAGGE